MAEVEEPEPRPDLVWDDQARGLCVRVYGNGSQSFFFVYRINDRQHFIRIGKTPVWSIETARDKAKYFRSIVDQGATQQAGAIRFSMSKTSSNTSLNICRSNERAVTARRFPPPWTVEEQDACFVMRDHNGQAR